MAQRRKPEQDEAAIAKDRLLQRMKEEIFPEAVRILQLREQTVQRQIDKIDDMERQVMEETKTYQDKIAKLIAGNVNSEEQPMGPVHGDEDEDHMKETTEATKNLQNSVTADIKNLKEPLNKMMKVAKFRAKQDVACLQGEFSKLEQVLNKLDSPDV